MNAPEPSRRRRFDLPAITILAFLAVVACLAFWKWAESYHRARCTSELEAKGVMIACEPAFDVWSSEWPFHNAARIVGIALGDRTYDEDDVRRLRRTFPGVPIYHEDLATGSWSAGEREKLPED